ncbi:MAG: UDP-N-acetylglucosamine 1-carboxyvinyltransferase [bacterium]
MNAAEREEHYLIEGPSVLRGVVRISGSKNAGLPIMAGALLTAREVTIRNVPSLKDVMTMKQVLEWLGAKVQFEKNTMTIDAREIERCETPFELMNRMRASVYVMGPLLARFGKVRVPMPGGCAIGSRPINYHIAGLQQMGANIVLDHGFVEASCRKLKGARIYLDFPSVGATCNLMTAAALADGTTVIENAAEEPHIIDLAWFLKSIGARIKGEGTKTITIEGVSKLHGASHVLIPDQIEAGTFMTAAAITSGKVWIENMRVTDLKPIIVKLKEAGVSIREQKGALRVHGRKKINAAELTTMPYPGFPTDMQPQMLALLSLGGGVSIVKETVWENRFMHVAELCRMGADIRVQGNTAVVKGVEKLTGAEVTATDLRAGAALVLAGLAAEDVTRVFAIEHVDRGYESFPEKLTQLGGKIRRIVPGEEEKIIQAMPSAS